MRNVLVIGNCQAQFLEGMFSIAGSNSVMPMGPNFMLTDADRDSVQNKLDAAAYIFIQRTADDYHLEWLRSSSVAATYTGKTFIWPNIYFDGYFPNTRYVYLDGWGKLQGPLEDYHLTPILDAYRSSLNPRQALNYLHENQYSFLDPFAESLNNLRDREKTCMVPISDHVEGEIYKSKCFYTPNHPRTSILVEMAKRLADVAGIHFDVGKAVTWPYHLEKIDLPVFDWIVKKYQLNFRNLEKYKGCKIDGIGNYKLLLGESKCYTPEELIEQYYGLYRAVFLSGI
jgi:hypothetical protein